MKPYVWAAVIAFASAVGAAPPSAPDDAAAAIQPSWIAPHVQFLADAALEGRDTGSRGYDIAAKYVAAQFAQLGLKPRGDDGTYFQKVPIRTSTVVPASASLTIDAGSGPQPLEYDREFFVHASGTEDGVDATGRLVFVGYGVTDPERHYDDYAGVDVRGAIVVFLPGTPPSLPRDVRAVDSLMTDRVTNAKAHGARACILLFPNSNADGIREHWIRQAGATMWLDKAGHAHNIHFGDAFAIIPGERTAAILGTHTFQEVSDRLKKGNDSFDLGRTATLRARFAHRDSTTVNVAAVFGGELGTEFVVYSAHLDHDGTSAFFKGDPVLHGALDNAGGIATLLAVARAFTMGPPPHRSVLFLAVTGEEKGEVGSDYFVHHPTVVRSSIVADLNCDNFLWYYPVKDISGLGLRYSTLDGEFAEAAKSANLEVSEDFTGVGPHLFVLSDHFPFLRNGIPAVSIFNGEKSGDGTRSGAQVFNDYMRDVHHTPRDSFDQAIDWNAAVTEVRFAFTLGKRLAGEMQRPRLKPNAFFAPRQTLEHPDECPPGVPDGTECAGGRDAHGSYYVLEKPKDWNGTLIVYAHGGPGAPSTLDYVQGLAGASSLLVLPNAHYAVAIPSYRDPSWHLDFYAEDIESAREAFVQKFGRPARTYVEGVSFGGQTGTRTIERFGKNYDGALLEAGVVAGGWIDVQRMLDFRVVYQYYCHNLPAPGEAQYPLWEGRPADQVPLQELLHFLVQRARECTGFDSKPGERTPAQQRALANIEGVTHWPMADFSHAVAASYILVHAFTTQMAHGANVFPNAGVRYRGSDDDDALNRGVARYAADASLREKVYQESTPSGVVTVPTISSHSVNDPRVPVEFESFYRDLVERHGDGDRLVQVYTTRPNHPGTSNNETIALLHALDAWVTTKQRPAAEDVSALCEREKRAGETCTFTPGYAPAKLSSIMASDDAVRAVGSERQ